MLPDALLNRYQELQPLRREKDLVVARGRLRGAPVMLWHREGLSGEAAGAARTVAERLQGQGGFGEPLEWHEGPSGFTWVVRHEEGQFLDEWLLGLPKVPLGTALHLLHDIARALEVLHRRRVAHLGLRPGAVLVCGGERPRARVLHAEALPFELAGALRRDDGRDDLRYTAPELTGRTASQPDARTDLYLLGLVAFRLLAGRLPFAPADTMGWLHAHLAVPAPDLRMLRDDTPAPLAELVAALLAKSPQQRPASARAVAQDLEHCLQALGRQQPLRELALRAREARFALPRVVHGRDAEHAQLLQALARVREGAVEVVVLDGPSGIGKSGLAARFLEDARAQGLLVAQAKCEQFGSPRPYPALAGLLDDLALQPGVRPVALGPEGGALAPLSPVLARRLALDAADIALPPEQARQRLLSALVALLEALAQDSGLVLFIDDLQWSDAPTQALLAAALAERGLRRVLLVLGLRAEAHAAEAPPVPGFETLPCTRIPLGPLGEAALRAWIEAALPGGLAHPETTLVRLAQRSGGNPLLLGQLVGSLVAQGQLVPGPDGGWLLDERGPALDALPASALEAAATRLQALGPQDAELLGLAAAAGGQFDAALLAQAAGMPPAQVLSSLERAQAEGLVEPVEAGTWRFLHDRLQQAAYESADGEARAQRHLRLGEALQAQGEGGPALFERCRHLQQAVALLSPEARRRFTLEAQRAAAQARASAAFAQAARLLREALAALVSEAPLQDAQRLQLLHDAAEAFVLTRDFEAAAECLAEAAPLEADPVARGCGDELRIRWLIAQERKEEALAAGVAALARLGLRVDARRATWDSLLHLARLKLQLRGRPIAAWADAPAATDPAQLQLQRLIFATVSVAHTLASPLYAVLGLAGARLSLARGLTPWSWQPISVAGHVLAGVFGDIDTGHALGELSVRLGERFGTHSLSFNHLFYVMHWKTPLASTLPRLRDCFEQAERSGNVEIAGYAAGMFVGVTWNAMGSLAALDDAVHEARAFAARHGSTLVHDCCDTFEALLALLRGPAPAAPIAPLRRQRADGRVLAHDGIFDLIHHQLAVMLNVMAGFSGDEVLAYGRHVRRNLHRMAGNFSTPLHHWFHALLHLDRVRDGTEPPSRRRLRGYLRRLQAWSGHCPANHAHRVASLEAELAALDRDPAAASAHYARAVTLARTHGFTGDAAIIAHRWSRHCARSGDAAGQRETLELAHGLYTQWGATCMVRQIEQGMPAFARPRPQPEPTPDLATLVKAAQAVGGEIEMGEVAARLLEQAMENAGARYAALLLEQGGHLVLAAQGAGEGAQAEPAAPVPAERTGLPQLLLRAVRQGGETVVIEDACAAHPWGSCARWQGRTAVSVLCLPVLATRGVLGVLYLENELAAGCFTPARATLAGVLASQAAIALANAQLFAELGTAHEGLRQANQRLEERVAERTRALQENHARLRALERQVAADDERQRIMRDLHDGLGSQLFVTLSRVERDELSREEITQALRACIADMRLVLEAMGPDGNDFLAAWGDFRFRWEAQLAQAGLASRWQAEGLDDALALPAETALQLLRIAQEALANVLRHSGAAEVEVRLVRAAGWLELEIRDRGRGMPGSPRAAGRGLANMRSRAQRMGASLRVEPADPGTRVAVRLPLP